MHKFLKYLGQIRKSQEVRLDNLITKWIQNGNKNELVKN